MGGYSKTGLADSLYFTGTAGIIAIFPDYLQQKLGISKSFISGVICGFDSEEYDKDGDTEYNKGYRFGVKARKKFLNGK